MPYVSTLESRVTQVTTSDPIKLGCAGAAYVTITGLGVYWLYSQSLAGTFPPEVLRALFLIPPALPDTVIRIAAMLVLWLALHTLVLLVAGLFYRPRQSLETNA